jgi:dihydroneopterin aldolase
LHLTPLRPPYYAVFVEDLRRDVVLGVLAHEAKPQPVSISVAAVLTRLGPGDGIEDVVDYDYLRQAVLELTDNRRFGLQETLCEALIEAISRHKGVHGVIVETRKLTVYKDAGSVGCRMERIGEEVVL